MGTSAAERDLMLEQLAHYVDDDEWPDLPLYGHVCASGSQAPVIVERIETRGVWFVSEWSGRSDVFQVVHAPTGATIAAYADGERGMRRAIELMRELPADFAPTVGWGLDGIAQVARAVGARDVGLAVQRRDGHVLVGKLTT